MNINVHIERLILDGLPITADQRPVVQAALEAEFTRLLVADGLGPGILYGGSLPKLAVAPVYLPGQPDAGALGRQIASTVHQGMSR